MKPSYVLTGLSVEQVKLGRLVTRKNIWTPYNAFHDPPSLTYSPDVHEVTCHSSELHYHNSTQSSVPLRLSKLFGVNRTVDTNVFLKIEADSTTMQMLSDYSSIFRSWPSDVADTTGNSERVADGLDQTREWIQNRLESDEDVFMVVGIKTVTNAKVTIHQSSNNTRSLKAGIPTSELGLHGLSPIPGASALDIMIAMTAGQAGGVSEKYEMKGTRVMAVQYCRVKVSKWPKSKIGEAKLDMGGIVWKWFVGNGSVLMKASTSDSRDSFMVSISTGEIADAAEIVGSDEEEQDEHEDDDLDEDEDHIDRVLINGVELMF
jgi:hypothetical protein